MSLALNPPATESVKTDRLAKSFWPTVTVGLLLTPMSRSLNMAVLDVPSLIADRPMQLVEGAWVVFPQ